MRVLIHSNAPWMSTGYGRQTRLLASHLRGDGHTVGISAFAGLTGADIRWNGYDILPHGQVAFGVDVLPHHIRRWQPDVVLPLMDLWKLAPIAEHLSELHAVDVLPWVPIDCAPIGRPDLAVLRDLDGVPVAMSKHGSQMLNAEGISAHYAPHAIDTAVFAPMDDRQDYRHELGVDGQFVIGLCAANRDVVRKAFPEQLGAFAQFHQKHEDSVLLVHTMARCAGGLDLMELAYDLGIIHAVRFTENYVQESGLFDDQMMCRWYNACDIVSVCSYAEGFGLPLIEAQACGTPVVTTHGSAMSELVGAGWRVPADDYWNPMHRAYWRRPRIAEIARAYQSAYNQRDVDMAARRKRAREFALHYDVNTVYTNHWKPILEALENE